MTAIDNLPPLRPLRPDYERAARRELESYVSAPSGRWRVRWRPGVVVGLSLGLAAAAGGGAAAAYVAFQPVTDHTYAHCYSLPSLSSNNGTAIASAGAPGSAAQVTDALATCAMLWRDGFLEAGVPHVIHQTPDTTIHPVPPLVVCTMSNGTAAVFPGDSELCGRLGLPPARPGTASSP